MENTHSALDYARQACDTMMRKYSPEDLPPKGRFHYHQGVFLSGMQKTYELCKEECYYNYIKGWVDSVINEDGEIQGFDPGQLDNIQPGVLLYLLYDKTGDDRYKKTLDTLLSIVKDFPRTKEGGFWHKHYHANEMWLDGLYMGGPICAQYAAEFGRTEFFDMVAFQALLMEQKTKDPKTGLLYHGWDSLKKQPWADPETGQSSEFWGRSIGWVPLAVLEDLDSLPEEHKDYKEMVRFVTDLLKALIRFQDKESGLWYQVIDKGGMEGNWLETSCSCMYTAGLCKAVHRGYLDSTYMEYAEKGYHGIISRLRQEGEDVLIENVCIGTDVGDYQYYCKRPVSTNDLHGVGAFLLMCTEMERVMIQREGK